MIQARSARYRTAVPVTGNHPWESAVPVVTADSRFRCTGGEIDRAFRATLGRAAHMNEANPFAPMVEAIADAVLSRLRPALDLYVRPRLLSIDQAAVYVGRTAKAVRPLVDSGAFPMVRTDGRIMLDVHDLDQWIEQGKSE